MARIAVIASDGEVSTQVWTAEDLVAVRSLRFFFSTDRARILAPALPVAVAAAVEARLRVLQSICGCSAAALGLVVGGAVAWSRGAPMGVVAASAFGAAVVAKVGALSLAYTAFRLQVSGLRRALQGAEHRAGSGSDDV